MTKFIKNICILYKHIYIKHVYNKSIIVNSSFFKLLSCQIELITCCGIVTVIAEIEVHRQSCAKKNKFSTEYKLCLTI